MNICIVEDHGYRNLYPITKTRPVFALKCGRFSLEERILHCFNDNIDRIHYIMRPELHALWEMRTEAHFGVDCSFELPAGGNTLFINGRVLYDESTLMDLIQHMDRKESFVRMSGEQWIAIYMHEQKPDFTADELMHGTANFPDHIKKYFYDNAIITWPWDLNKYNGMMIEKDFLMIKKKLKRLPFPPLSRNIAILNNHALIAGKELDVMPFVTFDATEGPILIGRNVTIEAGAYIKGPVSIGNHCLVTANTRIYGNTVIGDHCKTGGEISDSIIHGYSNKRHDGFLGHSYIGEWVNLGAGTNNSNLRNNYNTVRVNMNGELVDTYRQFVGLYMGDHSRSAIGTRFNTATFAGVGCNIFCDGLTPNNIDDFTWGGGEKSEIHDFKKFVASAQKMMYRRNVELSREEFAMLSRLFQYKLISINHKQADPAPPDQEPVKLYAMKNGAAFKKNPRH